MSTKHGPVPIRMTFGVARRVLAALVLTAGGVSVSIATATPSYALVPGPVQVVVTLAAGTADSIEVVAARANLTVVDALPGAPTRYLVQASDGRTAAQLVVDINADPAAGTVVVNGLVRNAEVDASGRFRLYSPVPPSTAATQYAGTLLGLDAAHGLATGAGITVAVVDTGVQLLPAPHPAFGSSIVPGVDVVDGDDMPDDVADGTVDPASGIPDAMTGHGTHVAGIVHMTAPNASIMPIRALDSTGAGTMWNVVKGMEWAADHGATVVNASFGGRPSAGLLRDEVTRLTARGVVVVAAAGNDGRDRDNFPAATRCAVSVATTDAADAVADFATTGTSVSLAAPGVSITSAHPLSPTGYAAWSGSSMASPFVAGTAALVMSVRPSSPGDVLALLAGSARPVTSTFGTVNFGRLDPLAALQRALANSIPTAAQARIPERCLP